MHALSLSLSLNISLLSLSFCKFVPSYLSALVGRFVRWAVVVAQLVERLLPTPDQIQSSATLFVENKEKEAGNCSFKKVIFLPICMHWFVGIAKLALYDLTIRTFLRSTLTA